MAQVHTTTLERAVQSIDEIVVAAVSRDAPEILAQAASGAADAYRAFRKGTSVLDRDDNAALFKDLMQSAYFVVGIKTTGNFLFHTDYVVLTPITAAVRDLISHLYQSLEKNNYGHGPERINGVECRTYVYGTYDTDQPIRKLFVSPQDKLMMKI